MDEQNTQGFSLEDIIREFSDAPETEKVTEDPVMEEVAADAPEGETEVGNADEQPAEEVSLVTDATIRLDTTKFTHGTVRNAQPIAEEEEDTIVLPSIEPVTEETFAGDWEPEYEQPIAEYVPPQPIIFHPRSRLRELKKKLVAGPEQRYYALSEKGLGRLQAAIFLSLLVVLLCAASTAMFALGFVPENRLRLMVFSQFFVLLLSALLGCNQLIEGVADLIKGSFSLNTLLVFTFIACCADGIIGLQEQRLSCCAAFSLAMTMALWSAYQRRNTEIGQMDTMRKATTLDAVRVTSAYYPLPGKKDSVDMVDGLLRSEGQVEDFMDHYNEPWKPEKTLRIYALVSLGVSLAIGILAGVLHSWTVGVQTLAVCLLAAAPATMFITLSRPMAVLERRLHAVGTVLCGWNGIARLRKKAVFPVSHDDLFPSGTTMMNGVKFFGKRDPDEVVAYATALMEASGCGLAPLFTQLLTSRNGRHYIITDVTLHQGGVSGMIADQTVLAGSLSFLQEMGVALPENIQVSSAVYVAVDKELCGLFALTYEKNRAATAGLCALCAYSGLYPVLVSDDFTLTEAFLHSKFNLPAQKVLLPDYAARQQLREKEASQEDPAALLVTNPTLAAFGYGVAGARTLYSACRLGVAIHLLGGILGLIIMLVLTLLGATALLTPVNMFLYQLVWMIPGLLVTEWTRHI